MGWPGKILEVALSGQDKSSVKQGKSHSSVIHLLRL